MRPSQKYSFLIQSVFFPLLQGINPQVLQGRRFSKGVIIRDKRAVERLALNRNFHLQTVDEKTKLNLLDSLL